MTTLAYAMEDYWYDSNQVDNEEHIVDSNQLFDISGLPLNIYGELVIGAIQNTNLIYAEQPAISPWDSDFHPVFMNLVNESAFREIYDHIDLDYEDRVATGEIK